jgi:serine phosphatase RsbU (regulator of sigma subunit)
MMIQRAGHRQPEGRRDCFQRLISREGFPLPVAFNGIEVRFSGSLPLGLVEATAYEQTSLEIAIGDAVVLMTDGIAEAHNDQRVLFGFPRVKSIFE